MPLPHSYFQKDNVVALAKDLVGKRIVTQIEGKLVSGIINETEAYAGAIDKASHAYNNRRTLRTEIMYRNGGCIYVYLCYGIHSLVNIVTNQQDIPHAILIRSIVPEKGVETMQQRRGVQSLKTISDGPGKVAKALGISCANTGTELAETISDEALIWVENAVIVPEKYIEATPRIGIDYAEEDKDNLWRFFVAPKHIEMLFSF